MQSAYLEVARSCAVASMLGPGGERIIAHHAGGSKVQYGDGGVKDVVVGARQLNEFCRTKHIQRCTVACVPAGMPASRL